MAAPSPNRLRTTHLIAWLAIVFLWGIMLVGLALPPTTPLAATQLISGAAPTPALARDVI